MRRKKKQKIIWKINKSKKEMKLLVKRRSLLITISHLHHMKTTLWAKMLKLMKNTVASKQAVQKRKYTDYNLSSSESESELSDVGESYLCQIYKCSGPPKNPRNTIRKAGKAILMGWIVTSVNLCTMKIALMVT